MKVPGHPVIRYSWQDALIAINEGDTLLPLADGHAEILHRDDGYSHSSGFHDTGAIGYLTKKSLRLLRDHLPVLVITVNYQFYQQWLRNNGHPANSIYLNNPVQLHGRDARNLRIVKADFWWSNPVVKSGAFHEWLARWKLTEDTCESI